MTDYVLKCEPGFYNLSPDAFHRNAKHYLKCHMDFQSPTKGISSLPYFLLCRAMELELKARHLQTLRQKEVKDKFGHNLVAVYKALPVIDQLLSISDFNLLSLASAIYKNKGFEYLEPERALAGYSAYPNLDELEAIVCKYVKI
ncbi:MAG: hypothetical protein Q7T85_08590 [Nitrosomonas sp.]|nr:hypothetical protein [Nitrosomonas sp.]